MSCPTFNPTGVYGQVTSLQDDFWGRAAGTYTVAEQYIAELADSLSNGIGNASIRSATSPLAPSTVSTSAQDDVPYDAPDAPEYPELEFNNSVLQDKPWNSTLDSITIQSHSPLTLSSLGVPEPSRAVDTPVYQASTEPTVSVEPVSLITIGEIDYSDLDDFNKDFSPGPAPTLREFTVPEAPTLSTDLIERLATWRAQQPDLPSNLDDLVTADQEPEILVWDAIDRALSKLTTLAPSVDATLAQLDLSAIHARAVAREEIRLSREETAIQTEFNARGWDMPDGFLVARLDEARRQANERILDVNREVIVQEAVNEAENARAYLASQTQQLSAWLSAITGTIGHATAFLKLAELSYQRAQIIVDARLKLAELELDAWERAGRGFDIEADVQKTLVERYREIVNAQRGISDINETDARLYEARQRGVQARADAYRALAQGVAERIRAEVSRLEEDRNKLTRMAEQVRLKQIESSQFLGKLQTINTFLTQTQSNEANLYGSDQQRYASIVGSIAQMKARDAELSFRDEELALQKATTQVQGQTAVIDGEARRLQALSSVYGALSQKYRTDLDAVIGEADVTLRSRGLAQERELRTQEINLREFDIQERSRLQAEEIESRERVEVVRIGVATLSTQASVAAQLAAGAMSAFSLNTGMGLSYSVGQSYSCSESQ